MQVYYYKTGDLAYASRKRWLDISRFFPFAREENKSVRLGDGANTSIKTSVDNICDYVKIDYTRWFVTDYIYLNGKQVQLNLQRDVIGEFGLGQCYGQIERGYTDTFLKYRKELSLNQILKDRKKLIPASLKYGNYSVDNHDNEMWGIMYFVKPKGDDPSTGQPYPEQVNINIPAFNPQYVNYPLIASGTTYLYGKPDTDGCFISFNVGLRIEGNAANLHCYRATIHFNHDRNWIREATVEYIGRNGTENYICPVFSAPVDEVKARPYALTFAKYIGTKTLNEELNGYTLPQYPTEEVIEYDYNGKVVKSGDKFYSYSGSRSELLNYGSIVPSAYVSSIGALPTTKVTDGDTGTSFTFTSVKTYGDGGFVNASSRVLIRKVTYTRTELAASEAGTLVIDTTQQLVDEPYCILAFPLYDVTITGDDKSVHTVDRLKAFSIFNTTIEYLSGGTNPYLIDAQIFPYCPEITSVASEIQGYPFFKILSTSYERLCSVNLYPYKNVKKEYITRTYSILSPEQSGKFDFNFYDYVNEFVGDTDTNMALLNVLVKVALKPYAIISSAVIQPSNNSLIGLTYSSDMRGCQPSSNGFECSLSSNAFETYKRQNSNYQQIFALQQNELRMQHQVERVNEKTQGIVNTITATAFGAVAGASLADVGIWNSFGAKAAGAAVGAGVSAATVGAANVVQYQQNEKLRQYEEYLQKANFDMQIGTIKNLPNSINRISSFNEIVMRDFWYVIEIYECSSRELQIADNFINNFSYGIGVYDFLSNYYKEGWFLRATIIKSNLNTNLHMIAANDLMGGVYIYE